MKDVTERENQAAQSIKCAASWYRESSSLTSHTEK